MHSLRYQLTALLLAVAFVFGVVHCTLDLGCSDEASAPSLCQTCWCHTSAVSETKALVLTPCVRLVERIMETFQPNGRLATVSIFNPPKA
ncbi:MAG: hypothetical protein WCO68_05145 [Verrucomicrobiota bacterium]